MDREEREVIWLALSNIYLDTELQESDFRILAREIKVTNLALEEVVKINKLEVYPVLYINLLTSVGVWTGFDEEWFFDSIQKVLGAKANSKRLIAMIFYRLHQKMFTRIFTHVVSIFRSIS